MNKDLMSEISKWSWLLTGIILAVDFIERGSDINILYIQCKSLKLFKNVPHAFIHINVNWQVWMYEDFPHHVKGKECVYVYRMCVCPSPALWFERIWS